MLHMCFGSKSVRGKLIGVSFIRREALHKVEIPKAVVVTATRSTVVIISLL
jgi:hypothetical protein